MFKEDLMVTIPPLPPPLALQRLITGDWISQAVQVAARLGVADHLAEGPRDIGELAKSVDAHAEALYRLLRALASVGVFTEVSHRRFALTPIGQFLRSGIPGSMRALAMLHSGADWSSWGELLHSVKTGETAFRHVHGMGHFEYLQKNPELGKLFAEGMTEFAAMNARAVTESYDFKPFTKIVDVGGGHGTLMVEVLNANPLARGIVFDLPAVVTTTRARLEAGGLTDRCEIVAGDFFKAVPEAGELYTLASIIHDWDDASGRVILENCRRAMSSRAKLLLIELLIPSGDTPFFGKWLDLHMLACFGGRERTEAEYRQLLADSGFKVTRVLPTGKLSSLIEAEVA